MSWFIKRNQWLWSFLSWEKKRTRANAIAFFAPFFFVRKKNGFLERNMLGKRSERGPPSERLTHLLSSFETRAKEASYRQLLGPPKEVQRATTYLLFRYETTTLSTITYQHSNDVFPWLIDQNHAPRKETRSRSSKSTEMVIDISGRPPIHSPPLATPRTMQSPHFFISPLNQTVRQSQKIITRYFWRFLNLLFRPTHATECCQPHWNIAFPLLFSLLYQLLLSPLSDPVPPSLLHPSVHQARRRGHDSQI